MTDAVREESMLAASPNTFLQLGEAQINKLKQLTLCTHASESKVFSRVTRRITLHKFFNLCS